MSDVICPYCDHDFDICHDDGHGMSEDERHEEECPNCAKRFVFTTFIEVSHTGYKADCLNDGEHQLKLSKTYPKQFSKMRCKDCGYERQPTAEENPP